MSKALEEQIERLSRRMAEVRNRRAGPSPPDLTGALALSDELLSDLDAALRTLRAAGNELTERNGALAQVQGALEIQRGRYEDLFASAPDGYLVTDAQGVVLEANPAAAAILGVTERFLVGKPLATYVAAEDRKEFRGWLNGRRRPTERWDADLRLKPRAGPPRVVSVAVATLPDRADRPPSLRWLLHEVNGERPAPPLPRSTRETVEERVFERTNDLAAANTVLRMEIAQRRSIQHSLQQSNELLERMFTSIHLVVAYMDNHFGLIQVNKAYAEAVGLTPETCVGRSHLDLYEDAALARDFRQVLETGEERQAYAQRMKPRHSRSAARYWDWSLQPVMLPRTLEGAATRGAAHRQPNGLVLTMVDVTEEVRNRRRLRAYQRKLRSLASELSLTEERERHRIALTLHDQIGQMLAMARVKLGAARTLVADAEQARLLDAIEDLLEKSIARTRSLTYELSSPILYELGLRAAIEGLADDMKRDHGLVVSVTGARGRQSISDDIRVVLFQAVRELLVNAAKHSRAGAVVVTIAGRSREIHIAVSDNGVGFNLAELAGRSAKNGGFGLFSIRERLRHLGGRLEVVSKPGSGTTATLAAPLKWLAAGSRRTALTVVKPAVTDTDLAVGMDGA